MTTNGLLLAQTAAELRAAGLHRVTISLDTLRRDRFIALTKRDYERANRFLGDLLILQPHDDGVRELLAEVQLKIGDSAGASQTLLSLSERYPDEPRILTLLGQAYMDQRYFIEAAATLERAA